MNELLTTMLTSTIYLEMWNIYFASSSNTDTDSALNRHSAEFKKQLAKLDFHFIRLSQFLNMKAGDNYPPTLALLSNIIDHTNTAIQDLIKLGQESRPDASVAISEISDDGLSRLGKISNFQSQLSSNGYMYQNFSLPNLFIS